MRADDLDAVVRVAAAGFPDHFEDRACFENRLALYPRGCFVLASEVGESVGYLVAYPWLRDSAPALNSLIAALPEAAELIYLHDLALAPEARGGGHTGPIVERLADQARADGWTEMALVAVNGAAPFWEGRGFVVVETPALAAKLRSYGPDARYMVRRL
ncbi:MAG: GNAT family N-acetyltransferase [Brevundimonas sp.]|nr:MAG: GNAT family N-acetyltransferase [Brevundimonas sp.]